MPISPSPDVRVWYVSHDEERAFLALAGRRPSVAGIGHPWQAGWYWRPWAWDRPDATLAGPFETEAEALADARGDS